MEKVNNRTTDIVCKNTKAYGVLIDVSNTDVYKDLNFRDPISVTNEVYSEIVTWYGELDENKSICEMETARLWNMLLMMRVRLMQIGQEKGTFTYLVNAKPSDGEMPLLLGYELQVVIEEDTDGKLISTIMFPDDRYVHFEVPPKDDFFDEE